MGKESTATIIHYICVIFDPPYALFGGLYYIQKVHKFTIQFLNSAHSITLHICDKTIDINEWFCNVLPEKSKKDGPKQLPSHWQFHCCFQYSLTLTNLCDVYLAFVIPMQNVVKIWLSSETLLHTLFNFLRINHKCEWFSQNYKQERYWQEEIMCCCVFALIK